jgi:predicted Zn-dependent protease with MMP-like domain
MRGPGIIPRRPGVPELPTSRERFDALVMGLVHVLDARWSDRLGLVEYAVEDTPQIPDDWAGDAVPLSSLVRGSGSRATRVVLFRRPIEHRCDSRTALEAMVLAVLAEQLGELLGIPAEEVDPRYGPRDG